MKQRCPKIFAELHPTLNADLGIDFDKLAWGSSRKVWWQCRYRKRHVWLSTVAQRTRRGGTKCPMCREQKIVEQRSLATRPDLLAQLHPTRNGEIDPTSILLRTERKLWWTCEQGHEWVASINNRSKPNPTNCPVCNRRQATPESSLAAHYPGLASQWHPVRNGDLTPYDVLPGSGRKVWWFCPRGIDHEWESVIGKRVLAPDAGCPYCTGRMACKTNSLASLAPEVAREWDETKNKGVRPRQVVAHWKRKAWWLCRDGHSYRMSIAVRAIEGQGCPVCLKSGTAAHSGPQLELVASK